MSDTSFDDGIRMAQELYDAVPHAHIFRLQQAIGMADNISVGADLKAIQNSDAGIAHDRPGSFDGRVDVFDGGLDKHRVVHRGAEFDAAPLHVDGAMRESG